MSKIRNLFKKFSKKNKTDQDFDDEGFDEFDSDFYKKLDEEDDIDDTEEFEDSDDGTSELQVASVSDEEFTSEIDLNEDKITFKDKIDHAKTLISDKFTKIKNKDLNVINKDSFLSSDIEKNKSFYSNINFSEFVNNFFSNSNRPKIHKYFQMSVVILIVYITGNTIGSFLGGDEVSTNLNKGSSVIKNSDRNFSKSKLNQIKSSNVFKTNKVEIKKNDPKKIVSSDICRKATRSSSLPIKLVNTIVLQDSVKSIASVQIRSGSEIKVFREGQKIDSYAKLDKIINEQLIVKNLKSGECESIKSKAGSKRRRKNPIKTLSPVASKKFIREKKTISGIKNDGNNFEIQRSFLKDKMKNIASLLTQAKGIQINNPDGSISFKITQIDPSGIFAYLGQEDGDIITQINGEPIKDLNQVMTLFGTIADVSGLSLTTKRNGEEIQRNYTVK